MTTTIGDFAKTFEGQNTRNISDLKEVDVNLILEDREAIDKFGKTFKYKVIVINNEDYRVPTSVIGNLKVILDKVPTLKKFSVVKKGTTK